MGFPKPSELDKLLIQIEISLIDKMSINALCLSGVPNQSEYHQ